MSRSSLCLAAALLFSSLVFAQHTTTVTPSAPPSPPPSVHISAPAPAPSPAPSVSHSAPNSPPSGSAMRSGAAPPRHVSEPASDHSVARKEPGSEHAVKADPELRKHICITEPCKSEPQPRTCVNGNCSCPAGQTAGTGGCVTTAAAVTPVEQRACAVGSVWNGTSCTGAMQCPAGQVRRGAFCQSDCSAVNAQAQGTIPEVREARQNRDEACRQDAAGSSCRQATSTYQTSVAQYRSLWGSAPAECRASMQAPDSI